MTLREIEVQSVQKNFRDHNAGYVQDRMVEEWSIYFDFDDFVKFKKEYPEFLEWLDSPEDHINELLKADAESNQGKVEWKTFQEYHNDVMAFIEMTEAQVTSLKSLLTYEQRRTDPE